MWLIDKDYDVVTLDFESYYGTGCSLSLQKLNTYSYLAHPEFTIHGVGVKVNDGEFQWFSPPEMEMALHEIFEDGEKPVALVCHNTNFDGFILHHFWDLHPDLYTDTMGLSRGIFPNRKHSLEALAERLWPNDPSKRKGKELINFRNVTTETLYANPKALERMIKYCKQDIELTHDAFMMMEPHFPDSELEILHLTLQMTCEPLLRLDAPRVEKAREDWIEERENAITASGVTESTLSSNPKFKALLENKGVKIIEKLDPKTEKMKPALGKADLGFQQMKAANPELKAIFDGRVAAKSIGQISRAARFLETAEICGGLMPCPLIYYSALTGRYGGSEALNLQNLTRGSELRKSLCAPPGYLVYVADSSNIEARMLAWISGQSDLIDVFRAGGDVYSYFASKLYGFEVNKKDHPHERFVGKVCTLGLGYGMGWRKFQDSMAAGMLGGDPILLSAAEAQSIVNIYRGANYAIAGPGGFWEQAKHAILDMYLGNERNWGPLKIAKDMLILPNGMALQYPGLRPMDDHGNDFEYHNGKFWTKIYFGKLTENIIQALARIVLFDQMLETNHILVQEGGRVVLNVHDEIIGVAPDGGARFVGIDDKGQDVWENDSWAKQLFERITAVMSTDRGWYEGLPLAAEGGYHVMYSK
jgi:DNA polymerase